MGVKLRIVAYAQDQIAASTAFDAAYGRVKDLDKILSNYRVDSEVSLLANHPSDQPYKPSRDLWTIMRIADSISRKTDGAFDVTMAPLTDLWRRARKASRLPDADNIARARRQFGFDRIRFDQQRCLISSTLDSIRLDFGGIGKGYAADQALKVLRDHQLPIAMVDLGGDIAIGDPPPGTAGWKVGLSHQNDEANPMHYVVLRNCGTATSGDTNQFVEIEGKRYSHIVDPKTGMGLTRSIRVTVVEKNAASADAYASACNVLGRRRAVALANNTKYLEVAGVEFPSGQEPVPFQSDGFPKRIKN